MKEAEDGVTLAELQRERSDIEIDHYRDWLSEPISALELASLELLRLASDTQVAAAVMHFSAAAQEAVSFKGLFSSGAGSAAQLAGGLSSIAGAMSTQASILSTLASYERRAQEWQLKLDLAQQDSRIAGQNVRLAIDRVRIVGQERHIAGMQADHAQEVSEFLAAKFTNVELYDWMSNAYERVYNFFLQHATAIAQLAAQQLAFERQETPPPYILADYWDAPIEAAASSRTDGEPVNRRGLTGSARLLQDISWMLGSASSHVPIGTLPIIAIPLPALPRRVLMTPSIGVASLPVNPALPSSIKRKLVAGNSDGCPLARAK